MSNSTKNKDLQISSQIYVKQISEQAYRSTQFVPATSSESRGYIELKEVTHQWQQKGYVMSHWNPSAERAPVTFVEKFLAGVD
ncbi:hypothetical protein RR46_04468 [Papilio xuthus]|uniref:Uncharacterized protein n=1 Tax=Papilio xuthus TaxID=66420 RepID=A0A194PTE0_PAPXU|nr:hypothetical protein RR46_04468 [Papilio xuthus]